MDSNMKNCVAGPSTPNKKEESAATDKPSLRFYKLKDTETYEAVAALCPPGDTMIASVFNHLSEPEADVKRAIMTKYLATIVAGIDCAEEKELSTLPDILISEMKDEFAKAIHAFLARERADIISLMCSKETSSPQYRQLEESVVHSVCSVYKLFKTATIMNAILEKRHSQSAD